MRSKEETGIVKHEWDITMFCDLFLCCGMNRTILTLDEERATFTNTNPCSEQKRSVNYGEIGAVDRVKSCCCDILMTNVGPIQPGCGCDSHLLDEIQAALKEKCNLKGDIAARKAAENSVELVKQLNSKVDLLLAHHNIVYTPVATMNR